MNKTEFRERFEVDDEIGGTNAYLLSSHGCFQRHSRTRAEQYMSDDESRTRSLAYRSIAEWDDQRIINAVATLASMGIKDIKPTESMESFVLRHAEEL